MIGLQRARELFGLGALGGVVEELQRVPEGQRNDPEYLLLYGAALARLKRWEEARAAFETLLTIDPDCVDALTWMAVMKKNRLEIEDAIACAQRAIALQPELAAGHSVLGTCYLYKRMASEAVAAFTRARELSPGVAEHEHNLALGYLMGHQHGEAIKHLRKAIELAPRSAQNYLVLASTYSLFGMAGQAIDCLKDGLKQLPDSAPLHASIAEAFASIRNDVAAESHYRRALELSPDSRGMFATWLLNQGRFEESNALYDSMLKDGSDPAMAYYGLMQSKKLKPGDEAFITEMQAFLESGPLGSGSEMFMHYALGKANEQLKNYEAAMSHFNAANDLAYSIHHAGHPLEPSHFREENEGVQATYEEMRDLAKEGNPTTKPIFIVGMIRSGTTLLDQIISSHPKVASAGELRFWIEESLRLVAQDTVPTAKQLQRLSKEYVNYATLLAGSAEHVTDKMPLNFAYVGIMNVAMPNARFVHIRRNPIDTCLSIYTTYFGKGAQFGYNKANIVAYYREYLRMMDYWRETVPADRLLEIEYEDLISDAATVIPRVIEFCGLPWDEACLHHDQNQSAINTPSRWQARQPIYRTSVERWRGYEPWLGEFAELLDLSGGGAGSRA